MADEKTESGAVVVKFDRTNVPKSPTFCEIYTNDTVIQFTPWDVRMMLSVITELGPNQGESGLIRVADVRLSLHHAKKIAQILTSHIQKYEDKNGPLLIPD